MTEFDMQRIIAEIKESYGDTVSIVDKRKTLRKFGRFSNLGTTRSTIMEHLGAETSEVLPVANTIDRVVSNDAAYTGTVSIEGQTISGNEFTFTKQSVTLTGQTPVVLATPLARATRITYASSDELATSKTIYVYRDHSVVAGVPQTANMVHLTMGYMYGRSQKCATAISKTDYWIITEISGGILKKTAAYADIEMRSRVLGRPFETIFQFPVDSNGNPFQPVRLLQPIIIPKNSDWHLAAIGSVTAIEVVGAAAGYLAKVS